VRRDPAMIIQATVGTLKYSAYCLDQYGVLHDGTKPLPGAVELIEKLKSEGKKLAILSNSSADPGATLGKLYKPIASGGLGFPDGCFDIAITSGGECAKYFVNKLAPKEDGTPYKALMFTWTGETAKMKTVSFLASLGSDKVQVTSSIEDADFAISHGSDVLMGAGGVDDVELTGLRSDADMAVLDPLLAHCKARNLPMYSANPDIKVVSASGGIEYMPGIIAKRYMERFEGEVTFFGKPHKEHFLAVVEALGVTNSEVVHVGDSLHHDIQGANAAGIDSIWVTGGIHKNEVTAMTEDVLEGIIGTEEAQAGHTMYPTYVVPLFA